MKHIMIIAVALLIISALPTEASEVERRIEANLSKNLDNMNKSFRKYKEVKTAIPEGTKNREKTLKMVTARLERELEAIRLALKSLTLYLDLQEFGNDPTNELISTRRNIRNIRTDIRYLKSTLGEESLLRSGLSGGNPMKLEVGIRSHQRINN